jgi:hypothetical protein
LSTETYNLWSLVVQGLIGFFIITTFIVYLFMLISMRKGATGQNILSVINFLQAPYAREARAWVRKHLRDKPYDEWTEEDKKQASLACSTYDVLSLLIYKQMLVPAKPFTSRWGGSIVDCYTICKPYITEMQKPEKAGPTYWNDLITLYHGVQKADNR